MTLPAKLGFGALALGSVGGLGYAGTRYFNNDEIDKVVDQSKPKTIKQLIDQRYTHILLSTVESDNPNASDWTANWNKYKSENKAKNKGEDAFQLPSWTSQIADGTDLVSELKTKCASLETSNDDSSYEDVTKYCSREVTIADNSSKDSLRVINEEASHATWKARESNKANLNKELKALGVADSSQTAETIRQKCIDAKTKKKSDSAYKDTYEAYKKVCVKKNGEE